MTSGWDTAIGISRLSGEKTRPFLSEAQKKIREEKERLNGGSSEEYQKLPQKKKIREPTRFIKEGLGSSLPGSPGSVEENWSGVKNLKNKDGSWRWTQNDEGICYRGIFPKGGTRGQATSGDPGRDEWSV